MHGFTAAGALTTVLRPVQERICCMSHPDSHSDDERRRTLADELIEAGRFFFARGWVPATSGNFSARAGDDDVLITVSGRHKGRLGTDDLMHIDLHGRPARAGQRSSAETGLHLQLYRRDPAIGAVLHTHSVNATVLSMLAGGALVLRDLEVLKAFPGIATHERTVCVPVLANDQDIARLAARVAEVLDRDPGCCGYLIAGHGFYTWGATVADAVRHVEAFEFLFECESLMRRMGRP